MTTATWDTRWTLTDFGRATVYDHTRPDLETLKAERAECEQEINDLCAAVQEGAPPDYQALKELNDRWFELTKQIDAHDL